MSGRTDRRVRLGSRRSLGGTRPTYGIAVAVVAFAYGYMTTGAIENDHFVMLARAFQVLYGDWPVRDFVDPGQPLAYLISTGAAAVFGPTLLVNVLLCLVFLAATAALTYLLALRGTASSIGALTAAALTIVFYPRLYNTTKVIVPIVAISLAWKYVDRPETRRLVMLAIWTALSFLLRHDYAVYLGIATIALLAMTHAEAPAVALRRIVIYAGWSLLFVSPWLLYVHLEQGLGEYFASAMRFAVAEQRRTVSGWPVDPLFYVCLVVPVAGLVLSRVRGLHLAGPQLAFASLLLLLIDVAFLRDVLAARIADVVPPMVVVAAAIAGHLWPPRTLRRVAVAALVIAVPAALIPAATRLRNGSTGPLQHFADVTLRLEHASLEIQPNPALAPLVVYLDRCMAPGDRVLVGGFAPEIPVLAHRAFASGLASWIPGYYEDVADIARARARLDRERVGAAVLIDGSRAFSTSWPQLAEWLAMHDFEEHVVPRINARTRVWLPRRAAGAPPDAVTGLPCPGSPV